MHSLMHQYVHQVWWISQLQSQILPKSCATSSMVQAMTTRFNHTALWTGGAAIMEPPGLIPLPQAGSVMFLTSSMSLTEMTSPRTMWIGASSGSWKRSDFQEIGRGGDLLVKDHPTNPISLHAALRERSSLKKRPWELANTLISQGSQGGRTSLSITLVNKVSEGHCQSDRGCTDTHKVERATKKP